VNAVKAATAAASEIHRGSIKQAPVYYLVADCRRHELQLELQLASLIPYNSASQ
jgi:hypothetical protein